LNLKELFYNRLDIFLPSVPVIDIFILSGSLIENFRRKYPDEEFCCGLYVCGCTVKSGEQVI